MRATLLLLVGLCFPGFAIAEPSRLSDNTIEVIPANGDEAVSKYEVFSIRQPEAAETVFNNSGNVPVSFEIHPALDVKSGHAIQIILDGETLPQRYVTPQVMLTEVNRGTHTLKAVVVDAKGTLLSETRPIEFHVFQASRLFPSRN